MARIFTILCALFAVGYALCGLMLCGGALLWERGAVAESQAMTQPITDTQRQWFEGRLALRGGHVDRRLGARIVSTAFDRCDLEGYASTAPVTALRGCFWGRIGAFGLMLVGGVALVGLRPWARLAVAMAAVVLLGLAATEAIVLARDAPGVAQSLARDMRIEAEEIMTDELATEAGIDSEVLQLIPDRPMDDRFRTYAIIYVLVNVGFSGLFLLLVSLPPVIKCVNRA